MEEVKVSLEQSEDTVQKTVKGIKQTLALSDSFKIQIEENLEHSAQAVVAM